MWLLNFEVAMMAHSIRKIKKLFPQEKNELNWGTDGDFCLYFLPHNKMTKTFNLK